MNSCGRMKDMKSRVYILFDCQLGCQTPTTEHTDIDGTKLGGGKHISIVKIDLHKALIIIFGIRSPEREFEPLQ